MSFLHFLLLRAGSSKFPSFHLLSTSSHSRSSQALQGRLTSTSRTVTPGMIAVYETEPLQSDYDLVEKRVVMCVGASSAGSHFVVACGLNFVRECESLQRQDLKWSRSSLAHRSHLQRPRGASYLKFDHLMIIHAFPCSRMRFESSVS